MYICRFFEDLLSCYQFAQAQKVFVVNFVCDCSKRQDQVEGQIKQMKKDQFWQAKLGKNWKLGNWKLQISKIGGNSESSEPHF